MLEISFIIPCKNEERYISNCINSILDQEQEIINIEIIVIDNGSTDKTTEILEGFVPKIQFYICPDATIAELRNIGVNKSTYEWIAFIDADVEIDKDWGRNIINYIDCLEVNGENTKDIITGSICSVPENATWVEKLWYEQTIYRDIRYVKYINSGNMLIHRELFNKIGGFNPEFITGEEEKLCQDALYHQGKIFMNEAMKAVHYGYPKDICSFFKRMRWHGLGMRGYLTKPWESKPLVLAIYYIFLLIGYISLNIIYKFRNFFIVSILFFVLQFVPVLIFAKKRYAGGTKNLILLTFLYVVYGWSKVFSVLDISTKRNSYWKSI